MATVPKLTAQPKIAQPVKVAVPTAQPVKVVVPTTQAVKVVVPTTKVAVPTPQAPQAPKVAVPTTQAVKVAVPAAPAVKVAVPVATPKAAVPKHTMLVKTAPPQATAESLVSATLSVWNGTPAEAEELLKLRYDNGDAVVDIKRRDVFTEILGMLQSMGFADTLDFLRAAGTPEIVLWDQSAMDIGRAAVERELMIYFARETGIKGVAKCLNCGSNELVFAMRQLRSGDEPMDVFVRCVMCGKTWKQR